MESEEVELWTKAQRHMEGPWRFVLVPSDIPNAFVTEVLPRRIFITTSFIDLFLASQDELALVLGHEISHLILGHSSEQNSFETSFRTLEILLLSLDPTPDGLLSLAVMALLASVRQFLGAFYSRDHERCADALGIQLAARACYDTRAGSRVFQKMHLQNVESATEVFGDKAETAARLGGLFSFFDSHPPSEERYRALLELSDEENKDKYCRGMKNIFWGAMGEEGRRHW
jgi:Zn-dependent protease with chaperone function